MLASHSVRLLVGGGGGGTSSRSALPGIMMCKSPYFPGSLQAVLGLPLMSGFPCACSRDYALTLRLKQCMRAESRAPCDPLNGALSGRLLEQDVAAVAGAALTPVPGCSRRT